MQCDPQPCVRCSEPSPKALENGIRNLPAEPGRSIHNSAQMAQSLPAAQRDPGQLTIDDTAIRSAEVGDVGWSWPEETPKNVHMKVDREDGNVQERAVADPGSAVYSGHREFSCGELEDRVIAACQRECDHGTQVCVTFIFAPFAVCMERACMSPNAWSCRSFCVLSQYQLAGTVISFRAVP